MWRKLIATLLAVILPTAASAGPLRDAVERSGHDIAAAQSKNVESGPDDGEDANDSDDGEDSDGWGNKAILGGGIAAAALGTVLLFTGHKKTGTKLSVGRKGVAVQHTVRF